MVEFNHLPDLVTNTRQWQSEPPARWMVAKLPARALSGVTVILESRSQRRVRGEREAAPEGVVRRELQRMRLIHVCHAVCHAGLKSQRRFHDFTQWVPARGAAVQR